MFQANVVEKIKTTHFMFSVFFFENRAVYEIMWCNVVDSYGHRWQYTIYSRI